MKEKYKKQIIQNIKNKYKKINLRNKNIPALLNRRCQVNCLFFKNDKIILCYCISKKEDEVFVHFINKNKKFYYDITLGDYGKNNFDYYFIEIIEDMNYINCDEILNKKKKMLIQNNSNIKFKQKYLEVI